MSGDIIDLAARLSTAPRARVGTVVHVHQSQGNPKDTPCLPSLVWVTGENAVIGATILGGVPQPGMQITDIGHDPKPDTLRVVVIGQPSPATWHFMDLCPWDR
jgi:hypothetical protein